MLHFDKTYTDTWERRKALLNGITYQSYLLSNHWVNLHHKLVRRKRFQKCMFCNCTKIEPHHKDYKWILTKFELRSIIPVCRLHHQKIHDFARKLKVSIRIATNQAIAKHKPQN